MKNVRFWERLSSVTTEREHTRRAPADLLCAVRGELVRLDGLRRLARRQERGR